MPACGQEGLKNMALYRHEESIWDKHSYAC